MGKVEPIEDLVMRIRKDLESMTEVVLRVRADVFELHERVAKEKIPVPWTQAEALQAIRRELNDWIIRVQTGEVVL